MNPYEFAAFMIEQSLFDKVDIYRYEPVKNPNGSTTTQLSKEPVHADIPGRISFSYSKIEGASPSRKDGDPISHNPKIFFAVNAPIKTGDIVVVKRFNKAGDQIATYKGKIGLPNVFQSHIEVSIYIEGTV